MEELTNQNINEAVPKDSSAAMNNPAPISDSSADNSWGLVLSGGGGKGAYQVGVWRALCELGWDTRIKAISGASVGALNAVLLSGVSLPRAEVIWKSITPLQFLDIDIPLQGDGIFSREGLTQLMKTIHLVQERLNEDLEVNGIVFTMYDSRTNLSSDVVSNVKENMDVKIYKTMIPRNVRLAESPSYGLPIIRYDSHSSGAQAYRELAKELSKRRKK